MNIALIDYGAGNLSSVANALRHLGFAPAIVSSPEGLETATHVVLPGVGSFGDCMEQLAARGLVAPIRQWIADGRPFLGFCLGYQILFESSEESPGVAGLGVFPGIVRRFLPAEGVKVPHMGWNSAVPVRPDQGNWSGLGAEPYFYFVHSYFPVPADPSLVAARTSYGGDSFASVVETPSLLACQFHPEKSQHAGLRLIRNFFDPDIQTSRHPA